MSAHSNDLPGTWNASFRQGNDWSKDLRMRNLRTGADLTVAGTTPVLKIYDANRELYLELSEAEGGMELVAPNIIRLTLTAAQTEEMTGQYRMVLSWNYGGVFTEPVTGCMTVQENPYI